MGTFNMKACSSKARFPQNTHFPQGRPGPRWTLTVHYTHFLMAACFSPTPDPWILLVRKEAALSQPSLSRQVASLPQPSACCTAASQASSSLTLISNTNPCTLDVIAHWLVGLEHRYGFRVPVWLNPCAPGGPMFTKRLLHNLQKRSLHPQHLLTGSWCRFSMQKARSRRKTGAGSCTCEAVGPWQQYWIACFDK